MISIYLKDSYKWDWSIQIPHEINNEFLWNARKAAESWKIKWIKYLPSFSDFWIVEFPVEKLDKLYEDFDTLEKNLNEIVEIVPLPKVVGTFDGMLYVWYRTNIWFDNYVELWTWWGQYFDTEHMLYLIWLIKQKILEAKAKWETLVFSGD